MTYPGLAETDPNNPTAYTGGCVIWHGDCNCDGVFDFGDINPFVALLSGTCDPNCPDCQGDDGGERMSPQELADRLVENIWPELYDDLVWVVAETIDWQETRDLRAYWQAVYAALTE